jgi:hypothetical protein
MRRIVVKTIAISLAGLIACNPFAPDQLVNLDVDGLNAPSSITPGSSLTVGMSVQTGGCTIFDHIAVLRRASGAHFVAMGRNTAKGRPNVTCPAPIRSDVHTYTLDPPFESPFTVTVRSESLPPLTATVEVR